MGSMFVQNSKDNDLWQHVFKHVLKQPLDGELAVALGKASFLTVPCIVCMQPEDIEELHTQQVVDGQVQDVPLSLGLQGLLFAFKEHILSLGLKGIKVDFLKMDDTDSKEIHWYMTDDEKQSLMECKNFVPATSHSLVIPCSCPVEIESKKQVPLSHVPLLEASTSDAPLFDESVADADGEETPADLPGPDADSDSSPGLVDILVPVLVPAETTKVSTEKTDLVFSSLFLGNSCLFSCFQSSSLISAAVFVTAQHGFHCVPLFGQGFSDHSFVVSVITCHSNRSIERIYIRKYHRYKELFGSFFLSLEKVRFAYL